MSEPSFRVSAPFAGLSTGPRDAAYLLWANPPLWRELRDPEYRES